MKVAYFGSYMNFRDWISRFPIEVYNDATQVATLKDGSTIRRIAFIQALAGVEIDSIFVDQVGTFSPAQVDIIKQLMQWPKLKSPLQSST